MSAEALPEPLQVDGKGRWLISVSEDIGWVHGPSDPIFGTVQALPGQWRELIYEDRVADLAALPAAYRDALIAPYIRGAHYESSDPLAFELVNCRAALAEQTQRYLDAAEEARRYAGQVRELQAVARPYVKADLANKQQYLFWATLPMSVRVQDDPRIERRATGEERARAISAAYERVVPLKQTLAMLDGAPEEEDESWRTLEPVELALHCPACGKQHLDIGEFATRVHRKHLCENTPEGEKTGCGHLWKPFECPTKGVLRREGEEP